jgi:hypothetical protein
MSGVSTNMSTYEVMSRISVGIMKNAIEQAETAAEGILGMLPPAPSITELGGLLDIRA